MTEQEDFNALLDTFPEVNPSNYDHDDVCNLNDWGVRVVLHPFAMSLGAPQWVPVSERLPDASKEVWLAVLKKEQWFYGKVVAGYLRPARGDCQGMWERNDGGAIPMGDITDWMPKEPKPTAPERATPQQESHE